MSFPAYSPLQGTSHIHPVSAAAGVMPTDVIVSPMPPHEGGTTPQMSFSAQQQLDKPQRQQGKP